MTALFTLLLPWLLATPHMVPTAGHLPVPDDPGMLFYIQRSTNENTIVYTLNSSPEGMPDAERPVHVFWRRYQEDGRRAELDFIQRTFAYGIRSRHVGNARELRCVAYSRIPLFLYPPAAPGGDPLLLVTVNGRTFRLKRIYLQIDGGAFWSPNVTFIEFSGHDPITGAMVVERIKP
ncbi:MAG: DUF4833 domain-containing protein [Flavobacteriales bacterium]|nr:DUF4833 domain-containing protein [Flavobacteriales bacterium]